MTMNGKISYSSPLVWTVNLETEAFIANSYKDGGDAFSTSWHRNSDNSIVW